MNPGRTYNVYDGDEQILENVRYGEMCEKLGTTIKNIAYYITNEYLLLGRYRITYADTQEVTNDDKQLFTGEELLAFAKEWNKVTAPFKRVEWVKSGGRKLYVGGNK